MRSTKRSAVSTTLAAALGTAALVGGPSTAAAADVEPQYWNYRCDYGRACVTQSVTAEVWNIEWCGLTGLNDYFSHASAHGNPFRINYVGGAWDYVAAWTNRPLDGRLRAVSVVVYC